MEFVFCVCYEYTELMSKRIAVVGAGAWGGWSAFKLQEAGYEVTLFDKSDPGHALSGSGGKTRIIRMAYGGSPIYTEMVDYAFKAWERYAQEWNETLYHPKEAIWMFRGIDSLYAAASIPLMKEKGFELVETDVKKLRKQYPSISFSDISSAFREPHVWFLEAAKSCGIVAEKFKSLGGQFLKKNVDQLTMKDDQCQITCENDKFEFDQVVVACGPWAKELIPELAHVVHVTRHEVYYFDAPEEYNELPIWVEFREGDQMYYGIPDHFGEGFKLAYDERQWSLEPDKDDRGVTPEILQKMEAVLVNRFPALTSPGLVKHHTCVYENSLDGDFIMDRKSNGRLIYLAGSSGHGFKMGPAVGQMVLDAVSGEQELPSEFSIVRFKETGKIKSQYQM